ncbi:hypothetical protein [Nocardioides marmoribigeumensis]|jgi:hypothetical protein|uniref:Uncharacterized protein n=1 Tax=Nocardioides marmoribigeumensis TaxID=433649 RepID=A0ABU2BU83_9ACTN|nr:hypothetical protein [Nocardioides marmoribigeumensis]MDR7362185.1 hypothetical protein [Nocardioides marmoribigeumensis]
MPRSIRIATALALSTTSLVAGGVAGAPGAWAACAEEGHSYSTPYRGRQVWVPTSTFSDWKKGGTITRTVSDGETTSKTTGSTHSIGVDGKVGGKIGPIGAEVTVKYNYTHSASTTTGTSVTRSWSYSFKVPTDALYRARAYKKGWVYKYKRTIFYTNGCDPQVKWFYGAAPVKSNSGTYYWALEKYANKGKLRYDGL